MRNTSPVGASLAGQLGRGGLCQDRTHYPDDDARIRRRISICRKVLRPERGTSMFLTAYLVLVLLAALPLARTFLTVSGNLPAVVFLHRLSRYLAYLAAA